MPAWPTPSPSCAFVGRRAALSARLAASALLAAGFARPRNFVENRFPFRASSHFLYLVGRHIEGAALLVDGDGAVLYAEPPDPAAALWTGREPSLDELSAELGLAVRSMDDLPAELRRRGAVATLPPPDLDTADWLASLLDRDVTTEGDAELGELDAELADAMIELRLCHDAAAVAQLRQAAAVSVEAHRAGLRATRVGLREAVVAAEMERSIRASGMSMAYAPIVTVHGEVLHNQRHDQPIGAGDLLLCDVGAETPEGWAADVTRTWPASGRFSASQRDVYRAVLAAQRAAIAAVRPGARFRDVHRVASRALTRELVSLGLLRGDAEELHARGAGALFFPHGIGHLLGLDVHDMEDLGDRAGYARGRARSTAPSERYLRLDRDLAPGMLVTIEPGFYRVDALLEDADALDGLGDAIDRSLLARLNDVRGIRIEDDVLVTESGCEVLTAALPAAPDAIEAAMLA
jgi:Xaa-Pro aminopeptidase